MKFDFPSPDKPWSTNEDRNLNPHKRADRIKTWKEATVLGYLSYVNRNRMKKAREPSLVRVSIPFSQNRKRDPHNYCGTIVKAIIDGLVLAGAWEDDTPDYVEHLPPALYKGDAVYVEIFPKRQIRIPCSHGHYESHKVGEQTCYLFQELEF